MIFFFFCLFDLHYATAFNFYIDGNAYAQSLSFSGTCFIFSTFWGNRKKLCVSQKKWKCIFLDVYTHKRSSMNFILQKHYITFSFYTLLLSQFIHCKYYLFYVFVREVENWVLTLLSIELTNTHKITEF